MSHKSDGELSKQTHKPINDKSRSLSHDKTSKRVPESEKFKPFNIKPQNFNNKPFDQNEKTSPSTLFREQRESSHRTEKANEKNPLLKRFVHLDKGIEQYEKIEKVGEGTYGEVFKAKHTGTGEIVAVKKIRMDREKEGFPITSIREIMILKKIQHHNIVKLIDVFTCKKTPNFYMVFEYIKHDLSGLIESKLNFSEANIKSLMKQLVEALFHCHKSRVLHRDLKTSNLLITKDGVLKLADFGLARFAQHGRGNYTYKVVTRWYRPPELLLESRNYDTSVDMWSVGCILGELLTGKAIFPGPSDADQLTFIYKLCGTPTEETWPGFKKLSEKMEPKKMYRRVLREHFARFPPNAVDLLDKLLVCDPSKRLSAHQCLDHPWFRSEPAPELPTNLPIQNCNEYIARKKRKERQYEEKLPLHKRRKSPQDGRREYRKMDPRRDGHRKEYRDGYNDDYRDGHREGHREDRRDYPNDYYRGGNYRGEDRRTYYHSRYYRRDDYRYSRSSRDKSHDRNYSRHVPSRGHSRDRQPTSLPPRGDRSSHVSSSKEHLNHSSKESIPSRGSFSKDARKFDDQEKKKMERDEHRRYRR